MNYNKRNIKLQRDYLMSKQRYIDFKFGQYGGDDDDSLPAPVAPAVAAPAPAVVAPAVAAPAVAAPAAAVAAAKE